MIRIVQSSLMIMLATFTTSPVSAQNSAPPPVCQTDLRYSEFDFWLGNWEVFVDGNKVGDNIIGKEEGGCLVLEKWADVNGGTGQSYNYFNPDTEKWRQVWVSSYMAIDYEGGLTEDGSMELHGEVTVFHTGKSQKMLGRWTLLEDGTVRQYFAQFDEENGEMVPVFTGIYRRKP